MRDKALFGEYCKSLALVRAAIRRCRSAERNEEAEILAGCERDLCYVLEWLATGWPPRSRVHRCVPVDPQRAERWLTDQTRISREAILPSERVRRDVAEVYGLLSERERAAVLLIYGEGFSFGRAAEILGVSKGKKVAEYRMDQKAGAGR